MVNVVLTLIGIDETGGVSWQKIIIPEGGGARSTVPFVKVLDWQRHDIPDDLLVEFLADTPDLSRAL